MTSRNQTAPCLTEELFAYYQQTCKHAYRTNHERSALPTLDERPNAQTVWHANLVCSKCRCRLTLTVSFDASDVPCPNSQYPLHHFVWQGSSNHDGRVIVHLVCSAPRCRARLVVQIQTGIITSADIAMLTDRGYLRSRYETARKDHASASELSPAQALEVFRSYVRDAAINSDANKRVPAQNRRFQGALGKDAENLLTRLGFRYEVEDTERALAHWYLPRPVDVERGIDQPLKSMLEDVKDELDILIEQQRGLETVSVASGSASSFRDIERLLGSLNCRLLSLFHCQNSLYLSSMCPVSKFSPSL